MAKNKPFASANGLFGSISITFLSYYLFSAAFFSRRALSNTSGVQMKFEYISRTINYDTIQARILMGDIKMRKATSKKKDGTESRFLDGSSVLILVSLVLVAVLTYFAFTLFNSNGLPSDLFVSEYALKKSDWLGFWGCVLGVISTVVFSSLSWKQNKTLNMINDKSKAQEMMLSTLRYTFECYSQVTLTRVCFFINGGGKESVLLEFQDKGKISPSELIFDKLVFSINQGGAQVLEICSFSNVKASVDNRKSSEWNKTDVSIVLGVQGSNYKQLFQYLKNQGKDMQSLLLVKLDCRINNLMSVTTHIQGQASFSTSAIIPEGMEHYGDKEKVIFDPKDYFVKTISYKFIGTLDQE